MSKTLLLDCSITLNGVDVSDHVTSVEVSFKRAAVDSTAFTGGGKEAIPGLKSDQFVLDIQNDSGASQINSILGPIYAAGSEFQVVVKQNSGPVSTTNPSYTGTCILTEWSALSGKVGDLSTTKVTLPTQRSGIAIATS